MLHIVVDDKNGDFRGRTDSRRCGRRQWTRFAFFYQVQSGVMFQFAGLQQNILLCTVIGIAIMLRSSAEEGFAQKVAELTPCRRAARRAALPLCEGENKAAEEGSLRQNASLFTYPY